MVLLLGMLWFWLVLVGLVVWFACEAWESNEWPAVYLAVCLAFSMYWYPEFIVWMKSHVVHILLGIPVYFVIGLAWSFIKWIILIYDKKDEVQKQIADIQRKEKYNIERYISAGTSRTEQDYIIFNYPDLLKPPSAGNRKSSIVHWICYWPTSIAWFLLSDLVRKIGNFFYRMFSNKYQSISNKIFKQL